MCASFVPSVHFCLSLDPMPTWRTVHSKIALPLPLPSPPLSPRPSPAGGGPAGYSYMTPNGVTQDQSLQAESWLCSFDSQLFASLLVQVGVPTTVTSLY